jgi:hypothetical protein
MQDQAKGNKWPVRGGKQANRKGGHKDKVHTPEKSDDSFKEDRNEIAVLCGFTRIHIFNILNTYSASSR